MKKGKKIYSLVITYDDAKEELGSILETIDRVDDIDELEIESPDTIICLSDYIDDKWFELIADSNIIGFA
jgi:hypothetical protein